LMVVCSLYDGIMTESVGCSSILGRLLMDL
jgi:hypothetical protein